MQFWLIKQKQTSPQLKTIDLTDEKCDFAFATAKLIERKFQACGVEKQGSLF